MDGGRASQWREVAVRVGPAVVAVGAELALLLDDGSASATAIGLTVVSGAALALRRSAPIVVLAVALVAAIGIVAGGETPVGDPADRAVHRRGGCERRTSLAALVPTAAVVTGLSVAAGVTRTMRRRRSWPTRSPPVSWPRGCGASAPTRRRAASAPRPLREREQRAQMAVQHERAAIARELHDIVAHSVSVMLIGVRGAREVLRASPDEAEDALARVEATGDQSLAELRRLLALMRTPAAASTSAPSRRWPTSTR